MKTEEECVDHIGRWLDAQVARPAFDGAEFAADGYLSISSRYRLVARLPDGMDGKQALRWGMLTYDWSTGATNTKLPEHEEKWIEGLSERSAASQFLRVYTGYDFARHLQEELTIDEYRAFRQAGGCAA